ncbi:hypothetical protein FH972_021196 [Carpinus fangiana]|uniref:Uncharacterized protein n=1 Tax=Carpinus fangiana TaxID=176857 RepID=A0A5N6KNM9_9ROSI|nr:hypothetical protein FH972_021196 [Carpinus fangiana]
MSLVKLAHTCSHLQNCSKARLGLTSIPSTKLLLSLSLALQNAGFISSVTRGGPQPPQLLTATSLPHATDDAALDPEHPDSAIITQANVASRRLWLGLKYWKGEPVLSKMSMAAACFGGVLVIFFVTWLILRQVRARHANPKYLPSPYLKQKWRAWAPRTLYKRGGSTQLDRMDTTEASPTSQPRNGPASNLTHEERVDRHTSVRSIATLPAYSAAPRPEEELIAREGERGGIDTVVEFPETAEEEEARRDEEMESLYQIRRARREERAHREVMRNQRREARERGDLRALEELRRERLATNAAAADSSATELMREHQAKDRGRRVSTVSYADLGVARHDGSRVRADSNDSDHRPLLDSAARPGMRSRAGSSAMSMHFRNQSSLSIATRALTPDISDDEEGRAGSGEFDAETWDSRRPSTSSGARTLAQKSTRGQDAATGDAGAGSIPPPPEYEGQGWPETETGEMAPPYESPTSPRAPRLAPLGRLPSIHVTPFSPIMPPDERGSGQEDDGGGEGRR